MAGIRRQYTQDFKSKEMGARQRAVALYFIDKVTEGGPGLKVDRDLRWTGPP